MMGHVTLKQDLYMFYLNPRITGFTEQVVLISTTPSRAMVVLVRGNILSCT
jgi:hypothetical protein